MLLKFALKIHSLALNGTNIFTSNVVPTIHWHLYITENYSWLRQFRIYYIKAV